MIVFCRRKDSNMDFETKKIMKKDASTVENGTVVASI